MIRKIILLMVAMLFFSGFTSLTDQLKERMVSLPQHFGAFDVKIAWAGRVVNGKTVLEGVFQNTRYAFMEDAEIWVSAFDSQGKLLGRSVSFIIPVRLNNNEMAPFDVVLPVVAASGSKLLFTYKYSGSDGAGSNGDIIRWMHSFESVVP